MTIDELKRKLIAEVIQREGGYSNRPEDRGGPTCWGITLATAREHGYQGDMRALPREFAAKIYAGWYWDSLKLDQVAEISTDLAAYLFDWGVNSGPGTAAKYLQRQLNVLNNRGTLFPDLIVDGAIGPGTLAALTSYANLRGFFGVSVLADTINAERIVFCRRLAERDEEQETFTFGWFCRVVKLSEHVEANEPAPAHWFDEIAA